MTEAAARRYAGRPVEEWKAARRQRLLDAALEMFSADGYQATSIERLCATAKVSTRHFYQEFPNKQAVLIAVHEQGVELGMTAVGTALESEPGAPFRHRLGEALRAYLGTITSDPRRARIDFVEVVGVSAEVERRRLELRRDIVELIATEGGQVVERGELPQQDFRFFGNALIGAINATVYDWLSQQSPRTAHDLHESLITLALNMLGTT